MKTEEWKIDFTDGIGGDEIWKEIHIPSKVNRIDRLWLGDYKETHKYRKNRLNKRYLLFIDVSFGGNFEKYKNREKYKEDLPKMFPELATFYEKTMCGAFLGFDYLDEALEYVEKIKKMIENDEI